MGRLLKLLQVILIIFLSSFLLQAQESHLQSLILQIDYGRISAIQELSDRLSYKATTLEDFLGWSANLSGNVPYDGALTARLSTELSYDLAAQFKVDRQNAEKQVNAELYTIYMDDIKRQTELAVVNTYCFTQYASTISRIFEQHKRLASSDAEMAFWVARIRQVEHDLENLQWELRQFLTEELSQIPALETSCYLEKVFALANLLAFPDVEKHPRFREAVLNAQLSQYQAEFFNAPASASLFLRSSADIDFSPQSTTRFSFNLGLQLPLDLRLDAVSAGLTSSVSESGLNIDIGFNKAFKDDSGGDATSENEKQLQLKKREIVSSIKSVQLTYETNVAREKLLWLNLPGYCLTCDLEIETIENPELLDALLEVINASYDTQNAIIQLLDAYAVSPSAVFK